EHSTPGHNSLRDDNSLAVVFTLRAVMQWSKLKARVKERICPELRDRVDFHLTSYRRSHDEADKVWITIDGELIFKIKHYAYERARWEASMCGLNGAAIKAALRDVEVF